MLRMVALGRARKAEQRFIASLVAARSSTNSYTRLLNCTTNASMTSRTTSTLFRVPSSALQQT